MWTEQKPDLAKSNFKLEFYCYYHTKEWFREDWKIDVALNNKKRFNDLTEPEKALYAKLTYPKYLEAKGETKKRSKKGKI